MRVVAISCALMALLVGCPREAVAQPSDQKAVAEHLFEEGRARLLDKDYVSACPKLAESQRLDPSIGTALYLAACYEKQGKTASAWGLFREAEELAARDGDTKRAAIARARAEELAGGLSKLEIVVPEAARVPGLSVTRDGAAVGASTWGTGMPIDPGTHVVEATAPGKLPFRTSIDVVTPLAQVVVPTLRNEAPREAPTLGVIAVPVAPIGVASPPPNEAEDSSRKTLGLAIGAVGVAGLIAGVAFTLKTSSLVSDASSSGCDTGASPVRCPDNAAGRSGLDSMDEARKAWRPLSIAAFAGGGVLTAIGGFLFFSAPRARSSSAIVVTPRFDARSGGLSVEGAL